MTACDIYLHPILNNAPRLLGLLNRNISSRSYGCFDREFWHYNTVDFACARKQEAVLTLTLFYLIEHEKNHFYGKSEILNYIRAAMLFWTKIQNANGSFNEWYPSEHSFVATSFSTYAVSESLLLMKDKVPPGEYDQILTALMKAGDWLISRNETRVMNQQTGGAIALFNLYLLTNNERYLNSSKDKITLLHQRQSREGWFVEYGGPDIGYLSLAIDYLGKYYVKTNDGLVKDIVNRSLGFLKYFIQPNLVAGGEYTSRNTEYLIPHGLEIFSRMNNDARFAASAVRKNLRSINSFPLLFDDRYLTYTGYTWLQAYMDADPGLDRAIEDTLHSHFDRPFTQYFAESGLYIMNDDSRHLIINVRKGGAFRLYDKTSNRTYSDSGILARSGNAWFTSGWLAAGESDISGNTLTVSGNMWRVPDKTMTTFRSVLLRMFQMTFGRSSFISLLMKERLRDILITKTEASEMEYRRVILLDPGSGHLIKVKDSATSRKGAVSAVAVFTKDTHIYVPSSRYYTGMKEPPFEKEFPQPVKKAEIDWSIGGDFEKEFVVH